MSAVLDAIYTARLRELAGFLALPADQLAHAMALVGAAVPLVPPSDPAACPRRLPQLLQRAMHGSLHRTTRLQGLRIMTKTKKIDTSFGVITDTLRSQLTLDLVAKGRERRRAKAVYDKAAADAEALEIVLGTSFEALMQERGEHA
jgi:hypothetical protein